MDTTSQPNTPLETAFKQPSVARPTTSGNMNKRVEGQDSQEIKKEAVFPERSEGATSKSRVVESDAVSPLPGVRQPMVKLDMTKPIDADLNIDKDTVVYLIYLLYKTNMIARNNLRNMMDEISKPLPDNVLKWLVNEAAKAGR